MKVKASINCVVVGLDYVEYQGVSRPKLKVIQDNEVINLSVPDNALSEVEKLESGQRHTLDVEFGSFYNRDSKKVIAYIKYIPIGIK